MENQNGAVAAFLTPDIVQRIVHLQILTVVWMT
jgi:hypothetical protein